MWFFLQGGSFTASTHFTREQSIALAAILLSATGHDDPIPVGEATESDFGALEAA